MLREAKQSKAMQSKAKQNWNLIPKHFAFNAKYLEFKSKGIKANQSNSTPMTVTSWVPFANKCKAKQSNSKQSKAKQSKLGWKTPFA
jgi:hypothetical protein